MAQSGLTSSPAYVVGGNVHTSYPNSASNSVDGGNITAAGVTVSPDPSRSNYYYSYHPGTSPTFGQATTFSLAGNPSNSVPSFSTNMYLPGRIQLQHSHGEFIEDGKVIMWNADASNAHGVYIDLHYDEEVSHTKSPTLPNTDVWKTLPAVADDGKYSLSATDLEDFPTGGYVQVTVGRGNAKIVTAQGKKYNVYGYSISRGYFIVK